MTVSPSLSGGLRVRPSRWSRPASAWALTLALVALPVVPGVAQPPRAAGKPTITAPASVDAGKKVAVSGKAPAGASVVVQRKQGKAFVTLGRATASSKGTWRTKVRFPSAGTVTVRALVGGKPSATRTVDVYAWLDLASQPMISDLSARDLPIVMNATTFPHSLQSVETNDFIALWNIDRKCTAVRSTVGLLDNERAQSDETETGTGRAGGFKRDGSQGPQSSVQQFGWPAPAPLSLSGLEEWDIAAVAVDVEDPDDDDLSVGVGRPQARCKVTSLPPLEVSDLPV